MKPATTTAPARQPRSGRAMRRAGLWSAGIAALALTAGIFVVRQGGFGDLLPTRPVSAPLKLTQLDEAPAATRPTSATITNTPPASSAPADSAPVAAKPGNAAKAPAAALGQPPEPRGPLPMRTDLIPPAAPGPPAAGPPSAAVAAQPGAVPTGSTMPPGKPPPSDRNG